MADDVSGNFKLPSIYKATAGDTVLASQHNSPLEEIEAALSARMSADGRKEMGGILRMGGFKIANTGAGVAQTDVPILSQVTPTITTTALLKAVNPTSFTSVIYGGSLWLLKAISAQSALIQTAIANDPQNGFYAVSTADSSKYWERQEGTVLIRHFQNAGTDAATIQAFFNFVKYRPDLAYDWSGEYSFSAGLVLDGLLSAARTKFVAIMGTLKLNIIPASPFVPIAVDIKNFESISFGNIIVSGGEANFTYASKVVGHGVRVNSVTFLQRGRVEGRFLRGLAYHDDGKSVVNDGNIGSIITGYHCGSGREIGLDANQSLEATVSARVDTGTALSQQSTFTATTLPPAEFDFVPARSVPMFATFAPSHDEIFMVDSWDRALNKVTIHPCPPAAVTSGTMRYYFGGAYLCSGQDGNINTVAHINAIACGVGVTAAGLYGDNLGFIHLNGCGVGLAYGSERAAAFKGLNVQNLYVESNCLKGLVKVSRSAPETNNSFINFGVGSATTAVAMGSYRISSGGGLQGGAKQSRYSNFAGTIVAYNGRILTFANEADNFRDDNGAFADVIYFNLLDRGSPIIAMDTATNTPFVSIVAPEAGINELFGFDSGFVIAQGNAASVNGAPLSVTFRPPAGHTINGGAVSANAVFTGLKKTTLFSLKWIKATNSWLIRPDNLPLDTGWAAMTGTPSKTAIDTASCTLPQLAQRVMALEATLVNAGLKNA